MIPKEYLQRKAEEIGVPLTQEMLEQFDRYAAMLLEWNEKFNLTAITDPEEIVLKHFVDSLLLLAACPMAQGASLIDVGAGAGFPSTPVAIVRPDMRVTQLDSLNKRVGFLETVAMELSLPIQAVHLRAEDGGQSPLYREKFDCATARAVAHLRELAEYCLPYVKVGGAFVALKGYEVEQELGEAEKAIRLLGGEIAQVKKYRLEENGRAILIIRKISQTSSKYPRPQAKIKKNPLI